MRLQPTEPSVQLTPQSEYHRRTLLQNALKLSAALTLAAPGWSQASAQSAPRIKVGQIGVKHAHATKLSVYRASPDYEVVGIVEPDAAAREQAAKDPAFRDLPWMSEEQLLSTDGLQVVLIETHVRDSLAAAKRAIAAGKHIHLDKPAGNDFEAYRQLLEQARKRQLLVQMGYMYRYNPAVQLLRQFLKEGWLGDIFEVDALVGKVVDDAGRVELAEFSGGIMFELGCHALDLVVGVLGKASRITSFHRHSGRQADTLRDNMLAVLENERAIATVRASAVEVDGGSRRHLVVCGTKGTFHIQPLDNVSTATITLAQAQGEFKRGTQTKTFPKFTRYSADAADMALILKGQKTNDFSYEHDLEVQRCVMACT